MTDTKKLLDDQELEKIAGGFKINISIDSDIDLNAIAESFAQFLSMIGFNAQSSLEKIKTAVVAQMPNLTAEQVNSLVSLIKTKLSAINIPSMNAR